MKSFFSAFCLFCLIGFSAAAQNATSQPANQAPAMNSATPAPAAEQQVVVQTIKFDEETHVFGSIKEEGGPVSHTFTFTNTSKAPMKLIKVKPSCGCTTPVWTQEVVKGNGTGKIEASYNPMNRVGDFHKTLTVEYTDVDEKGEAVGQSKITTVYIKGTVLAKPAEAAPATPVTPAPAH